MSKMASQLKVDLLLIKIFCKVSKFEGLKIWDKLSGEKWF